ncbi:MAG: MmgE/PrpD family protein [Streptosporangiales bacterium]|nr:MmgE/PrpD family protein [Streptosporangiales bacterium]
MRNDLDDRTSPETAALARFLAETDDADVPDDVLAESRRCLLDFLGVTIGAVDAEAPRLVRAYVRELGGHPQALLLGTADRVRATDAALANGVAGHVFDFDDTHVPTILHPTVPLYASSLALAQWRGLTGSEVVRAHALGYEVGARVSLALYPTHYDIGWHMTGTTGTLAAASASAVLAGLTPGEVVYALGLASTQASGHREHFGSMTKSFHSGRAAADGLTSALLAGHGYTTAPDPIQGRRGLLAVTATDADAGRLTDALGERWEIFRNGVKPYACGVVAHPVIDSVRRLGRDHAIDAEQVERIELRVNPLVVELTGRLEPRTGLEGKFSTVFASAIALIDGAAGEHQFTDTNVVRPDVRALMARIELRPDTDVPHTQAHATAVLGDGRTQTVDVLAATGTPENRMSDDELAAKYHDLVDPVLGAAQARRLRELVDGVEKADTLDDLLAATIPD